ncbi:hypothetical protein CVD19_14990 [Bacillus sp. T33-2]|nr:hypothetical protein CVD19_14990 [Bacillus sp. T33-2]
MITWLDVCIRSIVFIAILFLITKLTGKKQISQLSFFEYVSGITIGSIAAEVMMGLEKNLLHGIIGIVLFGGITYLVDVISLKSKKFREFAAGKETLFIKDGKIMEDNLKKEHYTIDELNSLLRQNNVFKAADVECAILEPNGQLSVLLKKENQPLTPKTVNMRVSTEKMSQTVIMDGQILDDALAKAEVNREWLKIELEKRGVTVETVFMAQVDSNRELTVDLYDDKTNLPYRKTH